MSPDVTRYNARGVVGVLTPQANPVAEVETAILLDPDVTLLTARMTDGAPSMLDRLKGYTHGLKDSLKTYGGAPLDAVGFACTGSSYFDADPAASSVAREGQAHIACPFHAAADVVHEALQELGVGKLALVSPYPGELTGIAQAYWGRRGYDVVEVQGVPPSPGSHPIYGLTARALQAATQSLQADHDAVLLMGTGAPTLPVIAVGGERPLLSSNLCLGWKLATCASGAQPRTFRRFAAEPAWRARLAQRYPSALLA
jgi:maleate isomerase